jgi:ABC-type phosphate transport system substrate-binding protein
MKLKMSRRSLRSVFLAVAIGVIFNVPIMMVAALNCPQGTGGTITISGDSDSMYAVKGWKEVFETNCPHYTVDAKTEGEPELGIRQACHATANSDVAPPVDIGGRSREFDDDDRQVAAASSSSSSSSSNNSNEYTFTCRNNEQVVDGAGEDAGAGAGDVVKKNATELVQILVAHDGLAFVVLRDTFAERCLQSLPGQGLTFDQLRWIYSSYTEEQLLATGWDATSVPNSDHNDTVRKWAALGGTRCTFEDVIAVAGVPSIRDFFLKSRILPDWRNGEVFRSDYYQDTAAHNVQTYMQSQQNTLGTLYCITYRPFRLFIQQKKRLQSQKSLYLQSSSSGTCAHSITHTRTHFFLTLFLFFTMYTCDVY